ncbi:MAG: glycosyltransferase family 39 protein [Planctomycetes bacterium]|nr:glycosyltransferase family 39 protein [Planctomycetota bacterium]
MSPHCDSRSRCKDGLFLVVCAALLWIGLGGHPIYDRSEGRYATASRNMAESHDLRGWLIPRFKNRDHLTKPPFTYWLQAGSMRLLGPSEWAVRMPSAVAGTLTLLLVFFTAKKLYGRRRALLTTGLLSVIPMQVMLGRIALTDGFLGLFWFGALASGLFAVQEPQRRGRWVTLFWLSMAGALFTKGPPAFLPLLAVAAWLALSGRWRDMLAFKPWFGLPLALIPLLAWAGTILMREPQAWQTWHKEIVDRATGQGDHLEPIWYFVPIFLGGLFPATAMMSLPGINYPVSRLREMARKGDTMLFWGVAVVLPFIVFSINKGKLPSYMLPLCPPMAMLCGGVLERWLSGDFDREKEGRWVPDFSGPLMVIAVGALVATPITVGLFLHWQIAWVAVIVVPTAAAAVWLWRVWRDQPYMRGRALLALWLSLIWLWSSGFIIENTLPDTSSTPLMLAHAKEAVGSDQPTIVMYDYLDSSLAFYYRGPSGSKTSAAELVELAEKDPNLVVFVSEEDWGRATAKRPEATARFRLVTVYGKFGPRSSHKFLLVPEPRAAPSTQPGSVGPSDDEPMNGQ